MTIPAPPALVETSQRNAYHQRRQGNVENIGLLLSVLLIGWPSGSPDMSRAKRSREDSTWEVSTFCLDPEDSGHPSRTDQTRPFVCFDWGWRDKQAASIEPNQNII